MTQKQIEQAAREYADDTLGVGNSGHYLYAPLKDGFIAGAESRQAEVTELVGVLRALSDVFIEMSKGAYPTLANEPIVITAQELIKKHLK